MSYEFKKPKPAFFSFTNFPDSFREMFLGPLPKAGDVVEIVCTSIETDGGEFNMDLHLRVKEAA